jgi:hypothetical protein
MSFPPQESGSWFFKLQALCGTDSIGIYVWKAGLIYKLSVSIGDVRTILFKVLQ